MTFFDDAVFLAVVYSGYMYLYTDIVMKALPLQICVSNDNDLFILTN